MGELIARSNFWIERDDEVVLSDWRVSLLEAIEATGSISGAAETLGVHYRLAWSRLREMEKRLGTKMTASQAGGEGGGGTQLTPAAREYVRRWRKFSQGLEQIVQEHFREAFEREG